MATALPRNSHGVLPRTRPHPDTFGHVEPRPALEPRPRSADRAIGVDVCRLTVALIGLAAYFGPPLALLYWVGTRWIAPVGTQLLSFVG